MEENQSFLELQVDKGASENLLEAARWGRLLAIMVLVALGLFLLLIILMGRQFGELVLTTDEMKGNSGDLFLVGLIVAFVFVGAIAGVLMSFLVKGANRIRNGLRNKDQLLFNSGLANLKNYFAMYGVIGILGLIIAMLGLIAK
jgi:hypothetical protein